MNRFWIYESEVCAIAQETLCWDSETGGDLFGDWKLEPVIYLSTRLGPESRRRMHECRFDLPYLEQIGTALAVDWRLSYFGDWHSHGASNVSHPSRTDRNRIGQMIQRNRFERIIEFIVTKSMTAPDPRERVFVHGYDFPAATWYSPDALDIFVIPGISPVREILSLRGDDALGQDWEAWKTVPLARVAGVITEELPETGEIQRCHDVIACRAIAQLVRGLEDHFQEPVVDRLHTKGREFSIQSESGEIRLSFGAVWPFPLQEASFRTASAPECHAIDLRGVTALQPAQVVAVCGSVAEQTFHARDSAGTATSERPSGQC